MNRLACFIALGLSVAWGASAQAEMFRFATDPFAGTNVRTTPGRQFVQNELFIPDFSLDTDFFSFDPTVFGVTAPVSFFGGFAADVPTRGRLNVIVLQDSDPDNDPTTPFNAAVAADMIAARLEDPQPGFFIYFNTALNVSRLVYSPDLSDNQSDLKILARLTNPVGQDAIGMLPAFAPANFEIRSVPEPATASFALLASIGLVGLAARWRSRAKRVVTGRP